MADKSQNIVQQRNSNGRPVCKVTNNENKNGYYYDKHSGFFAEHITNCSGNINDVYVYDKYSIDNQKYVNSIKLKIVNHDKFIEKASTIYGESSAYKFNNATQELKYEMFAIASVHERNKKAYGIKSEQAQLFRRTPPGKRNNSKMQLAFAALINALLNGFDYSYGATMWDGQEQAFYPETELRGSVGSFELHMNTMGWNISNEHYVKWKAAIGGKFRAPQRRVAPINYKNYNNKGRIRLESTAVYNSTIFWKVVT